jgi:hypothetical protein
MSYAVLEKQLTDHSIEKLARAFEQMPSLTKQDAIVRAKDAAGVLATHLSQSDAALLCKALGAQGVAALSVDQDSLPPLPKARALRRFIPTDEAMVLFDALGREQKIAWSHVTLLAAGNVSEIDYRKARLDRDVALAAHAHVALANLDAKQSTNLNLMLEMLLTCEPHRCYVEGNTFNYEYLAHRRTNRSADNFVTFVRDVMKRATAAGRNRGAEMFRVHPPQMMTYPSRHAFEQEIIWRLWARKGNVGIA